MHFKKRLSYIAIKNVYTKIFLPFSLKKKQKKSSHHNKCLYSLIIIKNALFLHIIYGLLKKINKFSDF